MVEIPLDINPFPLHHSSTARLSRRFPGSNFLPDSLLGDSSNTQLIASGDTSSDHSDPRTQEQIWSNDTGDSVLLAGADCNGGALNQIPYSRSRRSFNKRNTDICTPKQGAEQPLPLNPTSNSPKQPGSIEMPPEGVHPEVLPFYNSIYAFPGEDGKPDDSACSLVGNPLLRVPICAPPIPELSPSPIVLPARFCKFCPEFSLSHSQAC